MFQVWQPERIFSFSRRLGWVFPLFSTITPNHNRFFISNHQVVWKRRGPTTHRLGALSQNGRDLRTTVRDADSQLRLHTTNSLQTIPGLTFTRISVNYYKFILGK